MRATGANGILASATVVCGVPCSQPLGRMCGSKSATGEGQNKQGDCRALCWWLSLCYRLSLQKGTKQPGPLPVWAGTMGTQTSGWAQAPEQKQSWAGVAGGGGCLEHPRPSSTLQVVVDKISLSLSTEYKMISK